MYDEANMADVPMSEISPTLPPLGAKIREQVVGEIVRKDKLANLPEGNFQAEFNPKNLTYMYGEKPFAEHTSFNLSHPEMVKKDIKGNNQYIKDENLINISIEAGGDKSTLASLRRLMTQRVDFKVDDPRTASGKTGLVRTARITITPTVPPALGEHPKPFSFNAEVKRDEKSPREFSLKVLQKPN